MCTHRSSLHWRLWLTAGLVAAAASTACAPTSVESAANTATPEPTRASQEQRTLVPAGHGTLRQDEITVSIRNGPVLVKVTPLDEGVIRLVAPDTYQRLSALAGSKRADAERTLREPDLFLVSFFSYSPDVAFQPEDVQLFHQARLIRPSSILPITSGWGQQRLGQQESQTAIYVFEGPVDYAQLIRVRYGAVDSNEWSQIVSRLETERAKVLARVGG